jgi:hypothetical protein
MFIKKDPKNESIIININNNNKKHIIFNKNIILNSHDSDKLQKIIHENSNIKDSYGEIIINNKQYFLSYNLNSIKSGDKIGEINLYYKPLVCADNLCDMIIIKNNIFLNEQLENSKNILENITDFFQEKNIDIIHNIFTAALPLGCYFEPRRMKKEEIFFYQCKNRAFIKSLGFDSCWSLFTTEYMCSTVLCWQEYQSLSYEPSPPTTPLVDRHNEKNYL